MDWNWAGSPVSFQFSSLLFVTFTSLSFPPPLTGSYELTDTWLTTGPCVTTGYYCADDSTLVVLTGTVNLSPQSQPFMGLAHSPLPFQGFVVQFSTFLHLRFTLELESGAFTRILSNVKVNVRERNSKQSEQCKSGKERRDARALPLVHIGYVPFSYSLHPCSFLSSLSSLHSQHQVNRAFA